MVKKFLCVLLVILIGINILRISITPNARIMTAKQFLTHTAEVTSEWQDYLYTLAETKNDAITMWNDGVLKGFINIWSELLPDVLNIYIASINVLVEGINYIFIISGLPEVPTIPQTERGESGGGSYDGGNGGFGGGGGGAR